MQTPCSKRVHLNQRLHYSDKSIKFFKSVAGVLKPWLFSTLTLTLPTCLRCKQPTSWPLVRSIKAIHLTITLKCSGDTSSTPTCKRRLWATAVHNARTSCHWQHCIATSTLLMQQRLLSTRNIGRLVRWYRPIVDYTIGKYKFLFLLPKVNKHESGFRFR